MIEVKLMNLTDSKLEVRLIPLSIDSTILDLNEQLIHLDSQDFEKGIILGPLPQVNCAKASSHTNFQLTLPLDYTEIQSEVNTEIQTYNYIEDLIDIMYDHYGITVLNLPDYVVDDEVLDG